MKLVIRSFVLFIAMLFVSAQAADSVPPIYKSGYSSVMKLGKDLYTALGPDQQQLVSPQPISIETDALPSIRLLYFPEEPKPIRGVWISAGFIDLVNNIAHAQAIDAREKGYFKAYLEALNREERSKLLGADTSKTNYWTEEILNEQLSNFNSIVGMTVATKLAHHYLGHYEKYKARITKASPVTKFLTEKEWEQAFLDGGSNALKSGCTLDGALSFYESLEKEKRTPAWAPYFLPPKAKPSKLTKQLQLLEKDFLRNQDTTPNRRPTP